MVQEIFGIHEHIKDLCRRLAKRGYLAVAPYLYEREGDVSGLESIEEIRTKVVSRVPDAQVMRDLDATVDWAEKDGGDTKRLAATGFCWGGRIVWLYAAHSANLKAGAAWYGRLAGPTTELQPKNPVDIAKDLKAPVIGLYGGKDAGIPLDTVEQMRAALDAAHKPDEIHVYAEAQHGFNADSPSQLQIPPPRRTPGRRCWRSFKSTASDCVRCVVQPINRSGENGFTARTVP